ncbi:MAG: hypothetical protein PVG49_06250 [Desulfobacteraceae bacterium]|jgi:tetratricopeptide (TPR) repeat protein
MEAKEYVGAVLHYEKAAQGQPRDAHMFKALGEALHMLSREEPIKKAFLLEKRAMTAFNRAARLIPIDAEAFYGLGRSTARLEQMHPFLPPGDTKNPYNPLPAFRKAVELRPNGILYRYTLARYLYLIGDIPAFHQAIQALVQSSPGTYSHLKEEPFWSKPMEETVRQGLLQAAESNTMPRNAHMNLAELYERGNQPLEAIHHYALALRKNPRENQPSHRIHLGVLYLQTAQEERAEQSFMRALVESDARTTDLQRIFSTYKTRGRAQSFIAFFDRADREFSFSPEARLVVAKALIETQAYFEARDLLEQLNHRRPTAEAHYLLYQIAREQKDLDRMELAIQKATVLDPRNSRYHYLFSQVLRQAGNLEDAEKAATLAIDRAEKPSASMLNYRASLRRRLNDLTGALEDLNAALALAPEKAAYHASAAEVLIKLARFDQALAHAGKATALEPENAQYRKRHAQLKGQLKR